MPAKPKIPPSWKPCIKAIMVGSHGAITREMMVTYLGNYLGVQISESRIRQIMYDYENIDGKVQKRKLPGQELQFTDEAVEHLRNRLEDESFPTRSVPTQRKGDGDALG